MTPTTAQPTTTEDRHQPGANLVPHALAWGASRFSAGGVSSFSDADQIVASIRARLFALPDDTVVHTGHGDDTTIGAERETLGHT